MSNYTDTVDGRQNVLTTAVRFDGADVPAAIVADTAPFIDLPPNAIVLRSKLVTITADGGTTPTFNVGTAADEDGYHANSAVDAVAGVDGAGALIGEFVAEQSRVYISEGTGTISNDGDHVLVLEYAVVGRSNENYG